MELNGWGLPADAPPLRRQRPKRPRPPHLRPHHDRHVRPLPWRRTRPSTSSTPDQGDKLTRAALAPASPRASIPGRPRDASGCANGSARIWPAGGPSQAPGDQRGTAAKSAPAVGCQPRGPSREPAPKSRAEVSERPIA